MGNVHFTQHNFADDFTDMLEFLIFHIFEKIAMKSYEPNNSGKLTQKCGVVSNKIRRI